MSSISITAAACGQSDPCTQVQCEVIASDVPQNIRADKAVQEAYLGTEAA